MSFAKFFGGGKKKPPSPQEAIQKLRETEDMLSKKQEFLEKKIETELASAKKHGTKNKRAALNALKRKKRLEKQLEQIGKHFIILYNLCNKLFLGNHCAFVFIIIVIKYNIT